MATLASRGSGTPVTNNTTWTNVANAVDGTVLTNTNTYAVWTNTTANAVGYIETSGYDFSAIPAGSVINDVRVTMRCLVSNTSRITAVTVRPYLGTTALGTAAAAATRSTTATATDSSWSITLAQLQNATFKIRTTATRFNGTTAGTFSIDYADVTVDYTPPQPSITQSAYRFYADGTEAGSTALGTQSTPLSLDLSSGDVNMAVRVRLQSTTAVPPLSTDDWYLQYNVNSSGWIFLDFSAANVINYTSANLTNNANTTNRLGAGTGSFVAGKVSDVGDVLDFAWSANNYTELLFSVKVISADLFNGDSVVFRIMRNASTVTMTYTSSPTMTIVKSGAPVKQGTAATTHSWDDAASGKENPKGTAATTHSWDDTASGTAPLIPGAWINKTVVKTPRNGTTSHTVTFTPATAGNVLIAFAEGSVTSTTPSGWTFVSSAVGNTGLYCWMKTATAGESSFTTTHNGSDYPVAFAVFEYPAGTTFAAQTSAVTQALNGDNPAVGLNPALTYSVFTAYGWGYSSAGFTDPVSLSWVGGNEAVDEYVPRGSLSITDGYLFGIAFQDNVTGVSTDTATATFAGPGSSTTERLTVAFILGSGGPPPSQGSATTSNVWDDLASGKKTPKGTATTSNVWDDLASGKKTPKGTATTSNVWDDLASGKKTPKGVVTTSNVWDDLASGKKTPKGVVTTSNVWDDLASGTAPAILPKVGSATTTHTWDDLASGFKPVIGAKLGSATTAYSFDDAASGKEVAKGSAATTWNISTAANGKRTPRGSTTTSDTWDDLASGKRTPKGSATTNNTWDDLASGKKPLRGNATTTVNWDDTATGKENPKGSAVTSDTWDDLSTGKENPKGSGTTSNTWVASAVGIKPVVGMKQGSAATVHSWTTTANGIRSSSGSATTAHIWDDQASGTKPVVPPKQGSATTAYSFDDTATGKKVPKGTTSTSHIWDDLATGKRVTKGSATTSNVWDDLATGKKISKGSSSTSILWDDLSSGKRFPKSNVVTTNIWVATAVGIKPTVGVKQGTASTSVLWTTTAVGKRVPKASGSATYSFDDTATGKRFPKSSSATIHNWVTTSSGKRITKGIANTQWVISDSATGVWIPAGNGASFWVITDSATGKRLTQGLAITEWDVTDSANGIQPATILNLADAIYLGTQIVEAVYVGAQKVWPTS